MSGLLRESGELYLAPSRQFKETDCSSSEPAASSTCSPHSMRLSYLRCVGHQSHAICCNVVEEGVQVQQPLGLSADTLPNVSKRQCAQDLLHACLQANHIDNSCIGLLVVCKIHEWRMQKLRSERHNEEIHFAASAHCVDCCGLAGINSSANWIHPEARESGTTAPSRRRKDSNTQE